MSTFSETIVFLHIPKTAGATLHKILERKCGRDEILSFDGGLVVAGHGTYGPPPA